MSVLLIPNPTKDAGLAVTRQAAAVLAGLGVQVLMPQTFAGEGRLAGVQFLPEADAYRAADQVVTIGGDGTLLRAGLSCMRHGKPVLGVNLGHLGFLAEVDRQSVYQALDKLIADDYEIEERMMLTGTVWHGDKIIGQDIALNDIVIGREGPLRVVRFKNYVNDVYLNSYNADGIIIATPTGSTGYSLSCGGPIVSPNAAMTLMTPIAPHTLNTRSIIFPEEDVITVELGEGRRQVQEQGLASFDGDTEIPIVTGDRIVIQKASVSVKILKLNHLSFVEVLRQKME